MARGLSPTYLEAWLHHGNFTFQEPEPQDESCIYAQTFGLKAAQHCQEAALKPSHVTINQALLQICKLYWEYFLIVPKSHRIRVEGHGHRCIHTIFRESYERLSNAGWKVRKIAKAKVHKIASEKSTFSRQG